MEQHTSRSVSVEALQGRQEQRIDHESIVDFIDQNIDQVISTLDINQEERIALLSYYVTVKYEQFQHTHKSKHVQEAVEKQYIVVELTPTGDAEYVSQLGFLSSLLGIKYDCRGQAEDLEVAISKGEETVRLTPEDHPDLPAWLSNLGNKLERRYERTGRMEDLEAAITRAEEAVRLTPEDHLDLPAWLSNLGNKLERRYERTGRMEDLEAAITKAEEAVRLTPEDHPDLPAWLSNLGNKQLMLPGPILARSALSSFLRAWHCHTGIPSTRLRSAVAAVNLLVQDKQWPQAANLAIEAINLLPVINKRSLSRDDQQHLLSLFTGLAAKACSLILESSQSVEKALELLELGRGTILGLIIDDRRDTSHLRQMYPNMAIEYDQLRAEVNHTLASSNSSDLQEQRSTRRLQAVNELEECVERIRCLPGQERFLLGSTAKELQEQARDGPLVIVNVTNIRSDAIIVEPQAISMVSLLGLTAKAIRSWTSQGLTKFTAGDWGKKNKSYRLFLSWVWHACVKVVLDRLRKASIASPDQKPELRVWWTGTGDAVTIPFHAAGDHFLGSVDNTFSHAISSYTPTIKALEYSRERLAQVQQDVQAQTSKNGKQRIAVVVMPQTPGEDDLPGVLKELSVIQDVTKATFSVTGLTSPDVTTVQEELQKCHIFHFAGHGMADPIDPSQGCLMLQKASESFVLPVPGRLSVDDISRMYLQHAQLAYLSACSTAENSTMRLADEVIHLVSGFQVAGFGHVVGAMWPSDDQVCVDVARRFYQDICADHNKTMLGQTVAKALQSAVVEERNKDDWREMPLAWAQYVHFGA